MHYTHINPQYVEADQEHAAAEFDSILANTLPEWAAEMSEGYAWNDSIPARGDFQREADALAAHLIREHGE